MGKVEHQYLTVAQLEKMIVDFVDYWSDPVGRSDIEIEAANVLNRNCLQIAQQLLTLLKEQHARKARIEAVDSAGDPK